MFLESTFPYKIKFSEDFSIVTENWSIINESLETGRSIVLSEEEQDKVKDSLESLKKKFEEAKREAADKLKIF